MSVLLLQIKEKLSAHFAAYCFSFSLASAGRSEFSFFNTISGGIYETHDIYCWGYVDFIFAAD